MNISPAILSIPIIATSVNPMTERVAYENRVREQIHAAKNLNAIDPENAVNLVEKRQKNGFWQASDHPQYEQNSKQSKAKPAQNEQKGDFKQQKIESEYLVDYQIATEIAKTMKEIKGKEQAQSAIATHYQFAIMPSAEPHLNLMI